MIKKIAIVWNHHPVAGEIQVQDAAIIRAEFTKGQARFSEGNLVFEEGQSYRLELEVEAKEQPAIVGKPLVFVKTDVRSFSFFVHDVNVKRPIYMPRYGVAVTDVSDNRSYEEIAGAVESKEWKSGLQQIGLEPEESYEEAAAHTRALICQTWLGLSRDIRIFGAGFRGSEDKEKMWDWVQPRLHGSEAGLPENKNESVRYHFLVGRGLGCDHKLSRRLDEGIYPILHGTIEDNEITYRTTSFVSLEKSPLEAKNVKGTNYLVADGYGYGHMLTDKQKVERDKRLPAFWNDDEETVFYFRAEAVNTGNVPRYAWFKSPVPNGSVLSHGVAYKFNRDNGFSLYDADRVYCVSKLNGASLMNEESAILIEPGETAVFEFALPHRPVSEERAAGLIGQSFDGRLEECRGYWREKLSGAAEIRLPEKRVEEMVKAGLLHLDLVTYGSEPEGTLVPTIGVYTAIGSESAPIIQTMDSLGWGKIAERSLMFFLDKQHDNGFIQNFGGYMLETGAFLWCAGEHYRYTRDEAWIGRNHEKLVKAYEYIVEWRKRNMTDAFKGRGYGMIDGKTADPEDPFHSFMLNGYAYLGLSRLAEMWRSSNAELAEEVLAVAAAMKSDIREAFYMNAAKSPVVPIGNGTWVPTAAPWVEHRGPLCLFAEGGNWLTHGSMPARDSLLGPLYLVFQEVIEPHEEAADDLLDYHSELMCTRNVALSQPYYSIHPWVHLKRGEVKAFLKTYYNTFAGLADRETYTFWEHYWHASPHKTHEEAWFLMQTRWMLYMEEGAALNLLPGIPRKWLKDGEVIDVRNAVSYFGAFSVFVESNVAEGVITARVECDPVRKPETLQIRLPHPDGFKALRAEGGSYDHETETVRIEEFGGTAEIRLWFESAGR